MKREVRLAEAGNTGAGLQTLCEVLRKAAESARLTFNHDGSVTGVTTGLRSLGRRLNRSAEEWYTQPTAARVFSMIIRSTAAVTTGSL